MKTKSITSAQLAELQNCLQRINDILGLSITISDAHTTHRSSACPRKRTTPRVTNVTFTYRWFATAPQRITSLYQHLLKVQWIAPDTNPDDFSAIFEGNPSTARIKWIGKQAYLYYLIRQLVDLQLVSIPQNASVWQIVESHFLDKNSRPFHNFNKQKEPIKAKAAIDKLIEILQPSA
jgi:hypothetical protein